MKNNAEAQKQAYVKKSQWRWLKERKHGRGSA